MYKGHEITTVVPAHNEAAHVGSVIKGMPEFVDRIIVVDDCSQDRTAQIAAETGDSRVTVLRLPVNLGVGGAMAAGYKKALESGSGIVVKMDGDGQMPPEYLHDLLDAIVELGFDYAKGNRFLTGESLREMPGHRVLGNVVLTFMTKLASGYWHIFDPQNGYTAITAKALAVVDLEDLHRGFFFENDMLVRLNFGGYRVKDVAMAARYGAEQSDINILEIGLTFPLLLLRKFFHRVVQKYVLRDFSPIALFLFMGLALFGWGGAFGLYLWIKGIITHIATPTGTIMLSLLPLILGFQLLLQAIVLDIQETPR
ncbi:MAG TPA: glycosyltransferase family 2 protein [Blastocatellia bacterium]|nr:glycosyltransferase family 2 protein [Blastocatellia bacterium]